MREVLIVKISEFIESNGYITNAMARENFGFGSTKVKNLFNKLIKAKKNKQRGKWTTNTLCIK